MRVMYFSASDIQNFYDSDIGGIVRGIVQSHIQDFWPDLHGFRVMGCGYAVPYLMPFCAEAERVVAMMPAEQKALHWPAESKNLVFLSHDDQMPIENSSIDRVLLVHYLESRDNLRASLREIWRVLKANGRLLVVVPNRTGLWARGDWSPFGQGSPFTVSQLCSLLRDNLLQYESHKGALFVPPLPDSPIMMRSANLIEKMGCSIFPFVAGVHIVEASKQVYATVDKTGTGSAVLTKTREFLAGEGRPVPQGFVSDERVLDLNV